jgi:hypothetical protein
MDPLRIGAIIYGVATILAILWDTFETVVVPKTVQRRMRLSSLYYNLFWNFWHWLVDRVSEGGLRQSMLVSFGPISILFLFFGWASFLVLGFGMIHWGLGDLGGETSLGSSLYFSGVTFFTLGYGDLTPVTSAGRTVAVLQVAAGYGFLAVVIAFVPTYYQAFSRRERFIVMLDSRAGSNPSAGEILRRHAEAGALGSLREWLRDAEIWCADQLENYLSYPILAFYRSQHDDQSWLAAMTAVLDTSAVLIAASECDAPWAKELRFQAEATYAMGRHVIVDLAYPLDEPPAEHPPSRMDPQTERTLCEILERAWEKPDARFFERLAELRMRYEPYLVGIARDLHFVLPPWTAIEGAEDHWQHTAWDSKDHF